MNKIFLLNISDNDFDIDKYLHIVSKEKQKQFLLSNNYDNNVLSVMGEVIVRYVCVNEFKLNNSEMILCKNKYGKPYIKNNSNIHFNISHTKGAVVVAFSDDKVGIDIEKIKNCNIAIAERFFRKSEYDYVTLYKQQTNHRFFEIWTKREAYVKCIGKGLSIPLNSFSTLSDLHKNHYKTTMKNDYVISVYSQRENQHYQLSELTFKDINNMLEQ